jgi:hypothetical protein
VEPVGHAAYAVRQIEVWYKQYLDPFVQEGREQAAIDAASAARVAPISGPVLAYAHEQAWRHAVVRAQKSANPAAWAELTVEHEAFAYEDLLAWTAAKYRVDVDVVRQAQSAQGYRHFPR